MTIKNYIKDQLSYILVYFIAITISMTISILGVLNSGYAINIFNYLYALLISLVLLFLVLFIDYRKKYLFLKILKENLDMKNNGFDYIFKLPDDISNEYDLIKKGFINNYAYYIKILEEVKDESILQKNFNNRWIHEMKTPVSVIKLIIDNEKSKDHDIESRNKLNSIEEEIEKLSLGLEMALYTLRINNFQQDLNPEPINIVEVIRESINNNKRGFILNSVYPKINIDEEILVNTDKKWIKFVISQILNNSIKYTGVKKNDKKEVYINLEKLDGNIILSIKDNGIGISKSDLDRVFNPFFTGKNGRKYLESTGMGLYLVKEILEKLGHDIWIESVEDVETEVKIKFYENRSIYKFDN